MAAAEQGITRASSRRIVRVIAATLSLIGALLLAPGTAQGVESPQAAQSVSATGGSGAPTVVKTADLSQFQAGNIISDARFFDRNTMSASQIQQFLEAKVPRCEAGYTCLKDWYDTSRTTSADAMCGAYSGGVRERASTIIYRVAQACGINPQVILTTLQKEQGLVTHVWPSEWRYTIAMGQGCPDTAACDTRYYGFFNQVYGAAWQLKRYANPPGTSQYFTWYAPGKTWNVRWHPNEACGSSPVFIQNQATANLYYYTPYQPNAAALRAGYGEGDGCSAYGNRNFYQYFTDWFGSTQAVAPKPSYGMASSVVAVDGTGAVWAYPFAAKTWGDRVLLRTGVAANTVISVGDFDGDDTRDLLTVDVAKTVTMVPFDSAKQSLVRRIPVDWSGATQIVAAGNFSGRGVPGVLTTNSSGELLLWNATGYGSFQRPVVVGSGWQGIQILSAGTDVDGDAKPDVLAQASDGILRIYRSDGQGGWIGMTTGGAGWSGMKFVFSPGDFEGDGKKDLLAVDASGLMWLYRGAGDGTFAKDGSVGSGWQQMRSATHEGMAPTGVKVPPAGAGDLTSDGAADVVATTTDGAVTLYPGNGRGGWLGPSPVASAGPGDRIVTLGDFTGDGRADLALVTASGDFELLRGRGDGTVGAPERIGSGWSKLDLVVGGLDFDGDRRLDVLCRDSSGNLRLYRGDGFGGWRTGQAEIIGVGWHVMDALFDAGDFDGDARADLIARKPDGTLWIYPTNGAGSWRSPSAIGIGWDVMSMVFSPGDFDGTGPGIMARNAQGELLLYRGNGTGGWLGNSVVGIGWNVMRDIQ